MLPPANLARVGNDVAQMLPRPAASVLRAPVLLLRRRVSSASPFELLGLPSSATPVEIKEAYRRKALQLHPDLHPGDAAALAHFRLLPDARRRALGMARTGTGPGFASEPGFATDPHGDRLHQAQVYKAAVIRALEEKRRRRAEQAEVLDQACVVL